MATKTQPTVLLTVFRDALNVLTESAVLESYLEEGRKGTIETSSLIIDVCTSIGVEPNFNLVDPEHDDVYFLEREEMVKMAIGMVLKAHGVKPDREDVAL